MNAIDFPRGLRRRWRENWCQSWSLGRWEFEIEWVPRANGYAVFSLCRHSRPADLQETE